MDGSQAGLPEVSTRLEDLENLYQLGWDISFFRSRQTNEIWTAAREVTTEWQMSLNHRTQQKILYVKGRTLSEVISKAKGCIATGAGIRGYGEKDKHTAPIPLASKDGSYKPMFSF